MTAYDGHKLPCPWVTSRRRGKAGAVAGLAVCLALAAMMVAPGARAEQPLWVWPTSGSAVPASSVSRGFALPEQRWAAGHRGVDLLSVDGSPVRAAGAGLVRFAGVIAGRGVVVLSHEDGTRTTYEPVRSTVAAGVDVRAGQQIGVLTSAFSHCLPQACLHWGRLRGPNYLNPLALVARVGPARLLPVWRESQSPDVAPRSTVEQVERSTSSRRVLDRSANGWGLANASVPRWMLLLWCVGGLVSWLLARRVWRIRERLSGRQRR